jgi:cysteine-rich repeat protein
VAVCGDGKVNGEQCDDGNTLDGDGCSANCTVENYYECVNGTMTTPSFCIYSPTNIELTLRSINKIALENVGVFQFDISPFLNNMLKLNLKRDINFTCN